MTLKALVNELKEKQGVTAAEADRQAKAVFAAAAAVIERDKRLVVPGFGTFKRSYRGPRAGRNPSTGESITIAGRDKTSFKEA